MWQDVRYALRSLARRPLVTTVAVLSLALGIGVNAAIFSVFERLILRRLPVSAPDRIANVTSPGPRPGSQSTGDGGRLDAIFSYPLFRDLERLDVGAFRIAAHRDFGANLAYKGQTSDAEGVLVSGLYFPALGLTPALGRLLGPDDDRVQGGHSVVVLSHDYWSTRFGGDPTVLDDTLIVNGEPMTIVGVAPEGFTGNTSLDRPQVFVPLMMAERAFRDPQWNGMTARNNHWLYLFARLDSGVSRTQAEGLINVPFAGLIRDVEFPALRSGMGDRDRELFQNGGSCRGRCARATQTVPRHRRFCCSCSQLPPSCSPLPVRMWPTSCSHVSRIGQRRSLCGCLSAPPLDGWFDCSSSRHVCSACLEALGHSWSRG
jgi:hypothetical protein